MEDWQEEPIFLCSSEQVLATGVSPVLRLLLPAVLEQSAWTSVLAYSPAQKGEIHAQLQADRPPVPLHSKLPKETPTKEQRGSLKIKLQCTWDTRNTSLFSLDRS